MKSSKLSFLLLIVIGLATAVAAAAQGHTFSDPDVEYTFDLPDEKWKMTSRPSTTSPNVEYTYGDRTAGFLEVRRLTVKADDLMSDVIAEEEEKLKFRKGYVAGREENFAGSLRGTAFNFEFIGSGRNMSGRYYFLRAAPTTVYVLRFEAYTANLRAIRNQTDSIARTFELKKN